MWPAPCWVLPSHLFPYLLFFDTLVDLGCGFLVGPKQTDDTGPFWVQDVPILVSNYLVQLQNPAKGTGELR